MARPLRILVAGGWYHVTNRGHRRSDLYRTNTERQRFLGLVAQLPERFRLEVHGFVLMDNHYHLLVRSWAELLEAHGDWDRDGAMYYAVRHGGHRLAEVVAQMKTVNYQAASQAIKRFGLALEHDAVRRRFVADLRLQLSNI